MARETVTVRLVAKVNKPLAIVGALLNMAGDWLLKKAVKVSTHGA